MKRLTPVRLPLIALIATAAALLLRSALWPLDGRLYDTGVTGQARPDPQLVSIIGIDEAFMQGRHAYLAPRDRLARLIHILAAARPRAIVLDVWLDSRIDPPGTVNGSDQQLHDALLASKRSGVPVYLSDVPLNSDSRTGVTAHGSVLPYFKDASSGTGDCEFEPDRDEIVRDMPISGALTPMPLLSAGAMPLHNADLLVRSGEVPYGTNIGRLGQRLARERIPLNWFGENGHLKITPAITLLEKPYLAMLTANDVVLIGAAAPRLFDVLKTPYSLEYPDKPEYGVEVLAQATNTLLQNAPRRSHETSAALLQTVVAVLLLALLVAWCALRGALPGIALTVVAMSGAVALAVVSARTPMAWLGDRFWPSAPFLIAAVLACGLGVAWRQVEQAGELKLVRDAFGAYVGDEVLAKLGGKMPELGGEMRRIAVLFCDIRGYSALAERMQDDPAKLMSELNAHFEPLIGALKKRGAYTDNYVGDLVMALFGAPYSQGDHGEDVAAAVLAALDFVRLVGERNALRLAANEPPIEVGIGLHCGEAVVGNLGTLGKDGAHSKIHYTAIGDAVNIASRVESTTRKYDVPLLVTEEVVQACGNRFTWEFVDETTVKGRVAPVRLYRNVQNSVDET